VQEFPELPSTDGLDLFTVQGTTLSSLFERTLFSVSTDEARPNLNGVLFMSRGDHVLRAVSTDGYRLTMSERQETAEGADLPTFEGVLVPRKGAQELKKLLEQYPEVELGTSDQNIVVRTSDFTVHVRLLSERYPPYEEVIPKSNNHRYLIQRQTFLNALKRMNLVGEERLHRVTFDFQGGELLLESANANLGKVDERVELLEGSADAEMQIFFSSLYVMDVLNTIKSDVIEVHLGGTSTTPAIFKDPAWPQDVFIVVPLRS
jgi:DNA polymerase-3 subunit beta